MDQGHRLLMQLHLIDGVGAATASQVLSFLARRAGLEEDFFISPSFDASKLHAIDFSFVYELSLIDLVQEAGLSPQAARACSQGLLETKKFDRECELIERHEIQVVTLLDEHYPELLRTIHSPPAVIYVQGLPLQAVEKCVAVVGARAADEYAQSVLAAILPDVVRHGWTVVSGGAIGADAYAHEITLQAGGKTIVVLGSGLLAWYPKQNFALFDRVIALGGSVISTFPLETQPDPKTFPMRNRIISGLSQGCLVAQAARRSGALITAHCALEQGRQVFAVPGTLFSSLSEGCHDLLAQGAGIVTSARSILEALEGVSVMATEEQQNLVFAVPYEIQSKKIEREEVGHPLLTHFNGAMSIDELVIKSERSAGELHDLLFTLQLEGFVKQNFAGLWERL